MALDDHEFEQDGRVPDRMDIEFVVPMTHRLRFTEDAFGDDVSTLFDLLEPGGTGTPKVLVCCDSGVAGASPDLVERIERTLDAGPVTRCGPVRLVIGGEACKNDSGVVDDLLEAINAHDLDRRSYLLVIGGGAVLDAVGYAAAVAHRGVRLVRLPTTTLAQADSGVGVKNAVNWFDKKNWCGTFSTPWAVVNDRRLLENLSDRDFASGFSEAVKVALIKDARFFDRIRESAAAIRDRDWAACDPVIRESAAWHLRHITRGGDPFEALEARPLDFGHWSAHRLESMSNYTVRHGEAVSIGLAVDVTYSSLVHGLPAADRDDVLDCLECLGLPTRHPLLDQTDALLAGLEEFRQHLGGRLTVTMIEAPGRPRDVHDIDLTAMRDAIQFVQARRAEPASVSATSNINPRTASRHSVTA